MRYTYRGCYFRFQLFLYTRGFGFKPIYFLQDCTQKHFQQNAMNQSGFVKFYFNCSLIPFKFKMQRVKCMMYILYSSPPDLCFKILFMSQFQENNIIVILIDTNQSKRHSFSLDRLNTLFHHSLNLQITEFHLFIMPMLSMGIFFLASEV